MAKTPYPRGVIGDTNSDGLVSGLDLITVQESFDRAEAGDRLAAGNRRRILRGDAKVTRAGHETGS